MVTRKSRNYGRFLSFVLSFSALSQAGTGGDLSDLFNPDDPIMKGIGSKVLSLLDERSLGRSAQVSKKWNPLVQDTRTIENPSLSGLPHPLIPSQCSLVKDILASTHAIKDPFSPLIQDIRHTCQGLPDDQKRTLRNRLPHLLDPTLSLYPWHLLKKGGQLKVANRLTSAHAGFKRLKEVQGILESLSIPPLAPSLQTLAHTYEAYIASVCTHTPEDREVFLSPVFLQGDFLNGCYMISQSLAYQLLSLDEEGIAERENATGSSIVTHVGQIYAKQNLIRARQKEEKLTGTLDPGMEWAMSSFHRLLFGEGVVPSSLVVLSSVPLDEELPQNIQQEKKKLKQEAQSRSDKRNRLHETLSFKNTKTYALQVTSEIKGEFLQDFLKEALQNSELFKALDQKQVQGLILSALLTHPADAKGDNLMVTLPDAQGKRQVISIDNDLSFASMVIKEREGYHSLETRHLLFCIPWLMGQGIDEQLKQRLLSLDPESIVMSWLKSLELHNTQYAALQKGIDEASASLLKIPLKLKKETASTLVERLKRLQRAIRQFNFVTPMLHQLFEEMEPLAALYTTRVLAKETHPLKAFERIYKQEIPLEKVLDPTERLRHEQRVQDALQEETTAKDAYKNRTQAIEGSVKELFGAIDLFQHPTLSAFLTTAIEGFGDLIKAPGTPFLHDSWSKDGLILKAIAAKVPESVLSFLLEKGLDGSVTDSDRKTALRYAVEHDAPVSTFSLLTEYCEKGAEDKSSSLSSYPNSTAPSSSQALPVRTTLDAAREGATTTTATTPATTPLTTTTTRTTQPTLAKGKATFAWLNMIGKDGLTALDVAMTNQRISYFKQLIDFGASYCRPEVGLAFYGKVMGSHIGSPIEQAFTVLMKRNDAVRWNMCLQTMLPPEQPGQYGTPITTAKSGTRLLPNWVRNQILKDNQWERYSPREDSNHTVCRATHTFLGQEHALYFKVYPELSGIEEAVGNLTRKILGFGAPHTDLALINSVPVLISHSHGDKTKTLDYVLRHYPELLKDLDEESVAGLILVAMLINPEDGKPSNYVVEDIPQNPANTGL